MAKGNRINNILRNIREKRRLSFRDQHTDTEIWYMHISVLNLIAGFLALVLILLVILMSIVAFTPVLDFIPGYPGSKSRVMLINNIMRLDSLEQEIQNMQIYSENVALIMAGKSPVTRNDIQRMDSLSKITGGTVAITPEDSLLRAQLEAQSGMYSLNDPVAARRALRSTMELYTPITGVVSEAFNSRDGKYGVTLTIAANQPVMAVADGTVISSSWVPDQGYVLFVQHPNNLMSIYRRNTSVLKKVGERVRSGEIIGYAGGVESASTGKNLFEFELWHNGVAVDPQGYIVF